MLQLVAFLLFSGSVTFASIADDFLDAVIKEPLQREILAMNLDPAPLPDFSIPFTYQIGLIPISGRADFTDGMFNGLSKVQRFTQCEGPTINLREVKLECVMRFFGFSVVYDVKATVEQLLPIPFQVTGYINETLVKSAVSGAPASLTAKLNLLEITKFGDINVRPSNLGIFQYVYNAVEEELREEIRKEAIRIIMYQFPMAFGKALTSVKLPGLVQK
uniref:Mite allergen Lep d 7 n=1 Tax=Parasteatoda tepidariorum TaxID=114398 RepID=A0A2L2YN72_PARTP